MKKIIGYFLLFILLIFIVPIFCTRKYEQIIKASVEQKSNDVSNGILQANVNDLQKYDYGKYNIIRVLHTKTNVVEQIPLDEYLYGVVSAEMPADFEEEALKAQAIVARTYTIYKLIQGSKHENADICDDSKCCQAWISKEDRMNRWNQNIAKENWEKIVKCVNETKGEIITYDNKPINAFFHSNSGGKTEVPINVWGGSGYPYLQVVETAGEDGYLQYSSNVELTKDELINKIKENHKDLVLNNLNDVKIIEYTDSQRVKTIKIGNINLSGVEFRNLIGLKSTNFTIELEGDKIKFNVIGYGHGVGMSQTGANTLAKEGKSVQDILKHFYIGVEITDVNK